MERVAACSASAILPSIQHTGKLAIAGTERHADVEDGTTTLGSLGLDMPGAEHEVAYLIDPKLRSVKRIGAGMPRQYGVDRPWYTVGTTLDIEQITDERATAVDCKSRKRVTAAKRNWQVRLQALALWETYKKPVRSGLLYLDNGERDFHDFSRFDHAATWRDLEAVIAALEAAIGQPAKPHMGPWCDYCEAILACPAVNYVLTALMDQCVTGDTVQAATAEDVGKTYHTLKAVKAKYERMYEAVRLRASVENIPLGNGRHLRLIENNRGTRVLTERKDEEAAA